MKPLLVGESNPYGGDAEFALWPAPEGCAGWRLCRKILGLDSEAYLDAFDRVNLCDGPWSMKEARVRARQISTERDGGAVILLGGKVTEAFGFTFEPFKRWGRGPDGFGPGVITILPHPSGRCRLWWAPDAIPSARRLVLPLIGKEVA